MSPERKGPLLICGMHRSGTSLAALVLREAGLDIGPDVGPGVGQPRGHFEDRSFFDLHEAILAAAGRTCFSVDEAALARVPRDLEERARSLAASRSDRPLWGWKDPRTSLFLDFWERFLPEARILILYRHPVDVALSLSRRGTDPELRRDTGLAFRAWELYNRRLLAWRDRHPERCFVAHAPSFAADLPGFVRRLAMRLDLPFRDGNFASLIDSDELAPSCRPNVGLWERRIPEALDLYERLEAVADLSSAEEPALSAPEARLLRSSEILLAELLEKDLEWRRQLAAHEVAARVLREIESSRAYSLVRGLWALRRWLRVRSSS